MEDKFSQIKSAPGRGSGEKSFDGDNEFVKLAQRQAARDTILRQTIKDQSKLKKKYAAAVEKLKESEKRIRRYERNLSEYENSRERHTVNIDYLKNVVVQFLQMSDTLSEEQRTLIPVLGTILRFSSAER